MVIACIDEIKEKLVLTGNQGKDQQGEGYLRVEVNQTVSWAIQSN